jgi:hypothetical protein
VRASQGKNKFLDHAERNAFLMDVVLKYNHTRLPCLDYHAPAELLANLPGDNTFAGMTVGRVYELSRTAVGQARP